MESEKIPFAAAREQEICCGREKAAFTYIRHLVIPDFFTRHGVQCAHYAVPGFASSFVHMLPLTGRHLSFHHTARIPFPLLISLVPF